jgi:hypothetical protein
LSRWKRRSGGLFRTFRTLHLATANAAFLPRAPGWKGEVEMACYGIEVSINGHEHCIPIYEVVVDRIPPPNGDPMFNIVRDLAILKTINTAASHVADRRARDALTQAVQAAAKSFDLPQGVKLGGGLFQNAPQMEHRAAMPLGS